MPAEILQQPRNDAALYEFQREIRDEIALERQTQRFKALLKQNIAVQPGRSWSDACCINYELREYEASLPPNYARALYDEHQVCGAAVAQKFGVVLQKELRQKAERDLNELVSTANICKAPHTQIVFSCSSELAYFWI